MSPRKPKEFLFKEKGWCFKGYNTRDSINREKGIIYLSHTHLRIAFENGGERIIPVNEIEYLSTKRIFFKDSMRIYISTDTDETYTFFARDSTKKLYSLLSELVTNSLLSEIVDDSSDGRTKGTKSSSGVDTMVMVRIIFGVIGGILLIFGIILIFGAFGVPVNLPLGITFAVMGFVLLVIITNGKILAYLLLGLLEG